MTLYRSFLSIFPAISDHQQETFLFESFLLKSEILLQALKVREEEKFLQRFFRLFEI